MPLALPPPAIVVVVVAPAGIGSLVPDAFLQAPQPQPQLPQIDLVVEVIGLLPVQAKVQDLTRLLGQRKDTGVFGRRYSPTILELLKLVERNPARPRGRSWDSVPALTIRYHAEPRHVLMEYCIDYCEADPRTGAMHPKRRMVSYRAAEELVEKRLNKKLDQLRKDADRRQPQRP